MDPESFRKMAIKNLFLALTSMGLLTMPVAAQTFTTLHTFSSIGEDDNLAYPINTNSDGYAPQGGLAVSGNTLYGTAPDGGTNGWGTVFALNINGSNFKVLHTFSEVVTNQLGNYFNNDGAGPLAGLVLSSTNLYGTAQFGGTNDIGTVFVLSTNGSNFKDLHEFTTVAGSLTNSDGFEPLAGLILWGPNLYGTAQQGGTNRVGTVFSLSTNGAGFKDLHAFGSTNSDGAGPLAGLVLSGTNLYGTAQYGGTNSVGTVFSLSTNGSSYKDLHNFSPVGLAPDGSFTNSDGYWPEAGLVLSGNTLYGTAPNGGTNGSGTVFSISANGSNFVVLYTFTAISGFNSNADGSFPQAGLVLSGNTLYGTAAAGGTNGNGTVFSLNTDGSNFRILHTFSALTTTNSDGAAPYGQLIISSSTLYGTTWRGGTNGSGTVFSISLGAAATTPQLTLWRSGTDVVMTWPTNFTGYTLQSATNLVSSTTWINVSTSPIVINTNNVVTNGISGTRVFYRLSQ